MRLSTGSRGGCAAARGSMGRRSSLRPDLSSASNEEAFAGGWFHTGDLGRADEQGYTAIVDRKKDMIVTGGENLYSKEVEDVIYAVAEASIVGVPDPHWGENVTAVVVPAAGATVTAEDVIAACRAALAGYKKPKQGVLRRRAAAQRQRQGPRARVPRPLQLTRCGHRASAASAPRARFS